MGEGTNSFFCDWPQVILFRSRRES